MKKLMTLFGAIIFAAAILTSCDIIDSFDKNSSENNIPKIKIGNQIWMKKNLDVSHFRNGDPILEATSVLGWIKAGDEEKPAWCYYQGDPSNGKKYGRLYNWYAVNDPRGLAPKGWHIPKDSEWKTLKDNLGGEDEAGKKMRSNMCWSHNGNGTNESGFCALPGGWRTYGKRSDPGQFTDIGYKANWWSSSDYTSKFAWSRSIGTGGSFTRDLWGLEKGCGLYVRCIKD